MIATFKGEPCVKTVPFISYLFKMLSREKITDDSMATVALLLSPHLRSAGPEAMENKALVEARSRGVCHIISSVSGSMSICSLVKFMLNLENCNVLPSKSGLI